MSPFFADTSFFVAMSDPKDSLHTLAKTVGGSSRSRIVTTDFVLAEVGNFFSKFYARSKFSLLVRRLRSAADVQIVEASRSLWDRGFQLFDSRQDKEWSLTDCMSFEVMRELGIVDALTGDHHFEQAGFRILLK